MRIVSHGGGVSPIVAQMSIDDFSYFWHTGKLDWRLVRLIGGKAEMYSKDSPEYLNAIARPYLALMGSEDNFGAGLVFVQDFIFASKGRETIPAPKRSGETCKCCSQFCKHSEPNQPDGTFACYSCRQSVPWKYRTA